MHLPCYAHLLNLLAKASLTSDPGAIELKSQASSIVELTKQSGHSAEILEALQKNLGISRPKRLLQDDVQTHWNLTFEMLERIQELSEAITLLLNDPTVAG
eukprot:TCALIF_04220-PA protein Name:"Protein of unknown function" AED:0.33 eAED:0.33 QI:0/-1/0/1/-1/1/1/0/100